MSARSIAVIGAGNGAFTVAGAAALDGHRVRLWDRYLADHPRLVAEGAITLRGAVEGTAPVAARDDLAWAIGDAELIEVVVPGFALSWVASTLLPLVQQGQKVLLHPGGTGGVLEVAQLWRDAGSRGVVLGTTDSLAYATRREGDTSVVVHAVKRHLSVASVDPGQRDALLEVVRDVHPQAQPAGSLLEVALANLNPVIHPPITLLNATRIEAGESFSLYGEGVGEGVSRLIEALDRERAQLADALGVASVTLPAWVARAYGIEADDTAELFARLDREVYGGLRAPTTLDSRYLTEDVPLGLATFAELAAESRIDLPVTESVVRLARVVLASGDW